MVRPLALIGAPSSIGIRPYDDGQPRRLDLAPGTLRGLGLALRLGARDLGDVVPAPYRDFTRPAGGVRNEAEVADYSLALAARVAAAVGAGSFPLVVGGDCSIVLGAVLGARAAVRGPIGLAYLDGHADFATPLDSRTGSAASMCLGMIAGRGETPLARLGGEAPQVEARHIALIGRRDLAEPWYGHDAIAASGALDLPDTAARAIGYAAAAQAVLERLNAPELAGFWVHFDVDVLDPEVMPAVDSPEPGGPGLGELEELLAPLVRHPKALGLEVTIYDPALDPARAAGARLVALLEKLLGPAAKGATMIARTWHGRVRAAHADAYHAVLLRTGIPDTRATPGNRGILVQQWTEGEISHFLFTTLWDSIEAIKRFAGEDYERARYYPEDDDFLLEKEPGVAHTTVLLASIGP